MNVRVFLLILVTGLFMAAWNGDQAAEQRFLARRNETRAAIILSADRVPSPAGCSGATLTSVHQPKTVRHQLPLPFPTTFLAAGQYRAVSETGITFEMTVAGHASAAPDQSICTANAPDGTRWYFVRIKARP